MTRSTRPLTEGWQVRPCLGDTWRWLAGPGRPTDEPGWLPARVPGAVLDDAHRAGLVADPFVADQSLAAEWVPQRTWLYRLPLTGVQLAAGERALLRFDGVDHDATVLVDGEEVAGHSGMFVPFEVDVTHWLADGDRHLLAVAVHPAPANEPQVGRTDRVTVHKARMDYGWDFCPRMPHQGIWKPVTLRVEGPLALGEVSVAAEATGEVTVEVRHRWAGGHPRRPATGRLTVELLDPDGRLAATREAPVTSAGADRPTTVPLNVPDPRLWTVNGLGPQPLYTVRTTLTGVDGEPLGQRSVTTGFRRVRMVANPGAPDGAVPYTLEVNGRRVYAKGWNWVPLDARYGVPRPEKLAHLLQLAADAGVNLLRVWGGGLLESEEFYRRCDELGLLVWQEFSLSSSGIDSVPSHDPAYLALLEREAHAIVPALRHHPSLALWGPGNELHHTVTATPLDESTSPAVATLAAVVRQRDPDRVWLPGSPAGRAFLNRLDLIEADPDAQHDVHGPWEHQGLGAQQRLYDAGTCLLHSEFGVEGMANRRAWNAVVPADRQWPTGRDNPLMEHLGAWWNNTPLVLAAFGGRPADPDTVRRASRQLQHDGLRYAVEANLRRAPRSSGTLPWQFDEPFPNAWCTSAVDHLGEPKSAYYAVRRAYRDAHVCARFATQAWAGRERFEAELWSWERDGATSGATVRARVLTLDGTAVAEVRHPAGRPAAGPASTVPAAPAGRISVPLAELGGEPLFLLDLALLDAEGRPLATARWTHSATADLAPLLDVPPADVTAEPTGDAVRLAHAGGPAALGLWLADDRPADAAGWAVLGDNLIDLLPGESVRVPLEWRAAPEAGRCLRLEGWNVRARRLA
ncbi:glycoside hydrolase family 2 protein [Streptomyces triticirhizae]|uniref:beta-mannosidase n=1 Tax=Streptomyces triticirhizae TaxID=2483353 RepID=A0A3M2LLN0_9ACTN|nr:sugar-binding domain-containing protein [Streptomyces triticirhizae]RMI38331.1 hypothetical protein EBN88_17050 [Streptomyces triticirhizae]